MFKTQYNSREICTSETGSFEKVLKAGKLDKNGVVKVVEKGKENFYNYIQSFADSCDINVLLARFTNGDTNALNQVNAQYLDVTGLPKSYAEAFELVNDASQFFAGLPVKVKEAYNNNLYEFVSDIGSDNFNMLFAPKVEEVAPVVEVAEPAPTVVSNVVSGVK